MTLRALLLEDDPALHRLFRQTLQNLGLQVSSAYSLQEAEQVWQRQGPFDLLLVDMQLPDGTGLAFLRRHRDQVQREGVQVVILTAEPRFRYEAEDMGFEFYLEKPVSLVMLQRMVARLLGLSPPSRDA